MKRFAHVALTWAARNAAGFLATASLAAIAVGCAMERPSLGFLVPGSIVFVSLTLTHLFGRGE